MRVAFIGLGVMGYPMAGHLAAAGHSVCVYNRSPDKAETWCAVHEGSRAATPAAAAEGADFVFVCVGNDEDVRSVVLGERGALSNMRPAAVLVDHTTASAGLARELYAEAGDVGVGFLDAPLSGGQAGAESGQLTIMVGGDAETVEQAQPLLASYARATTHIGAVGSGQLAKMVNQICIAGVVQGLAEGLRFAQRAELDVAKVIEAISQGAAQSWQMQNRWESMHAGRFDFGFAVDWMRKDLALAFEEARRNGSELQMTQLVDAFYAEVQELGGRRWDTSSLIARLP